MTPVYTYVESTVEPSLVDIQLTTVYLRRNISKKLHNNKKQEIWVYDEAQLTHDEFTQYATTLYEIFITKYDSLKR